MGSALTSPVVENRARATHLLSATMKNLPFDFLNVAQMNFIITFYADRLMDHHSVVPHALTGILALVHMFYLPEKAAPRILHSLFFNVPCQSQVRADRDKIFEIVQTLADARPQGKYMR